MKDNLVHDAENHSYMGESKTPVIEASFTAVPPSVGTRTGLFRTLISGEVQSATCVHGLPRPALAVHNLMEQARFAHLCTVMSRMHHRRDGYPIGSLVDFAPDPLVVFTSYVLQEREMSSYENVVGGKLKLKGKPLDVIKAGGAKKKKKHKKHISQNYELVKNDLSEGQAIDPSSEDVLEDSNKLNTEGNSRNINDHLTPAERRYLEQKEKIDAHRLAKTANKSHRDRIEDFNQYLANMSEHYDIPKVGPG